MAQTDVSKDKEPLNPEELVQRAQDSLEGVLAKRAYDELRKGMEEIRASLAKVASPVLGEEMPEDFFDLLAVMKKHKELCDFVTPEIQKLCDFFHKLVEQTAEKVSKRKPASRRIPVDADGLDKTNRKILTYAQRVGVFKNDSDFGTEIGLKRSILRDRLKKLVEAGFLKQTGHTRGKRYELARPEANVDPSTSPG